MAAWGARGAPQIRTDQESATLSHELLPPGQQTAFPYLTRAGAPVGLLRNTPHVGEDHGSGSGVRVSV